MNKTTLQQRGYTVTEEQPGIFRLWRETTKTDAKGHSTGQTFSSSCNEFSSARSAWRAASTIEEDR